MEKSAAATTAGADDAMLAALARREKAILAFLWLYTIWLQLHRQIAGAVRSGRLIMARPRSTRHSLRHTYHYHLSGPALRRTLST
jgi:hypothetical protein